MKIGPYSQFSIRNRMSLFSRPPKVTRGHERSNIDFFKIGQMTYQIEGNCMGNLMHSFLSPPEVTQGHTIFKKSKIFKIGQMKGQ